MDFIESGKLSTDSVKFFVLDEADRLLDSGSQELVMKLFSRLPKAATGTQRLQVFRHMHKFAEPMIPDYVHVWCETLKNRYVSVKQTYARLQWQSVQRQRFKIPTAKFKNADWSPKLQGWTAWWLLCTAWSHAQPTSGFQLMLEFAAARAVSCCMA